MKYIANEGMGSHGDYGRLQAEKCIMMRISQGIGGSRKSQFFAKEIDHHLAKDEQTGMIVKDASNL